MPVHHLEYDLNAVMGYFIDGFENPPGEKLLGRPDWFIDPTKGKVIFRLVTEESSTGGVSEERP